MKSSNFECPVSARPPKKKTWSDVLVGFFFLGLFSLSSIVGPFPELPKTL